MRISAIDGLKGAVIALTLALGAGCGSAQLAPEHDAEAPAVPKSAISPLKVRSPGEVAPGYELGLSSLEDENLRGKFRVEFDGTLKLPYNVTIQTDGMTLDALRSEVNRDYAKFFKTAPDAKVSVIEQKYWIDVRGLVEKPGQFLVTSGASLDEALADAGGLQKNATARYVRIQQGDGAVTIKLSDYYAGSATDQLPKWQGGDIVFFQSDRDAANTTDEDAYLQFLGEVRSPGEYRYVKDADIYYYLSKAGGPTDKADLDQIEVIRARNRPPRSSAMYELSDQKSYPEFRPGDIVILHADKQSTTERVVTTAAGIASILNTMLLIILLL